MRKKSQKNHMVSGSLAIISCFAAPLWAQLGLNSSDALNKTTSNGATLAREDTMLNKSSTSSVRIHSVALKKHITSGDHTTSNSTTTTTHLHK